MAAPVQPPNKLTSYLKAGFSLINLITPEETRAEREVIEACKEIKRKLSIWSTTEGFIDPFAKNGKPRQVEDPIDALVEIKNENPGEDGKCYVMRDLHVFFQGTGSGKILRILRDIARDFKQQNKNLIITSPMNRIPPELERDFTLIEFDLPTEKVLGVVWERLAAENGLKIAADEQELIVQAARGLTTTEAENAYSKATIDSYAVKDEKARPAIASLVMKEKALTVKKNGILEYISVSESMKDIGGLAVLKKWLSMRRNAYSKKAREFGLPMPKGAMFVGLPGCGKSLGAKATASALGVPLIRFDISKVFAGLVGMSETNMRNALSTIDALGNCVVWMDELEKGLSGMGGGGATDNGVSNRVFGSFLTWLQEKRTPSFIVATVNRIDGLPPELLRKGRWDEIFYVPLPDEKEREEILRIHIEKPRQEDARIRKVDGFIKHPAWKQVIEETNNFSGAEIEDCVVQALFSAFAKFDGEKDFDTDMILSAALNTTPLAESRKNEMEQMKKWAEDNATDASKTPSENDENKGRKLRL